VRPGGGEEARIAHAGLLVHLLSHCVAPHET
jgi:hypothetical protein